MATYAQIINEEPDTFAESVHDEIITINSVPTKRIESRIDTKALNGLRGIAAVHIMLHHAFEFSKLQQNLLGSVQMPLFFLISGFILALKDGKQRYCITKCCTELRSQSEHSETQNAFNGRNFYQRRIARTIPIYYLTSFAAIPLVYSGYATFISPGLFLYITIALTLFAVPSWFGPFLLNPPAWFVSTIWFFYWVFPSFLPKLQRYTNDAKQSWIIYHYLMQLLIGAIVYIGLLFVPFVSDFAFNIATMWPPTRLPIFIMGVLAGLLRNQGIPIKQSQVGFTVCDWRIKCNYLAIVLSVILIPCVIVDRLTNEKTNFSISLQLPIAWWQLQFVYALTMDNGSSFVYKVLSSKWMLELGRISYSLYLVHFPLIGYICWCLYGTQRVPNCEWDSNDHCNDKWDRYNDHRLLPLWCIPMYLCVSVIFAVVLSRFMEEPMRRWLRPTD